MYTYIYIYIYCDYLCVILYMDNLFPASIMAKWQVPEIAMEVYS